MVTMRQTVSPLMSSGTPPDVGEAFRATPDSGTKELLRLAAAGVRPPPALIASYANASAAWWRYGQPTARASIRPMVQESL
jgi:hypothetical protein